MAERESESGTKYDSTPIPGVGADAGEYPYRSGIHKNMYKDKYMISLTERTCSCGSFMKHAVYGHILA